MTRTALVTGAIEGIGSAVVSMMRAAGMRVLTTDLTGSDIAADLASDEGRSRLVAAVTRDAPEGLDVVVACAGVAMEPPERVVGVNYFGVVETLECLRPLLARRPGSSGIAIASSAVLMPVIDAAVQACLDGDQVGASQLLAGADDATIYATSKRALALWVRRAAVSPAWAGTGIALNAVAPGVVKTNMSALARSSAEGRAALQKATPIATPDYAEPAMLAEVITALASIQCGFIVGQILFADGGSDAILRPDPFGDSRTPAAPTTREHY